MSLHLRIQRPATSGSPGFTQYVTGRHRVFPQHGRLTRLGVLVLRLQRADIKDLAV
jgi:hypothetical protein